MGLYTQDPDLVLVTHQQAAGAGPPYADYAGLVKQAVLGLDGVLRAQWWEANSALRGDPLDIILVNGGGPCFTTSCNGSCLTSGLWLEGTIAPGQAAAGLWLQTATGEG